MKFCVYVIRDRGVESSSLPFYVASEVVAKRQFSVALRQVPPSARPDFALVHIGTYDDVSCYHDPIPVLNEICDGTDDLVVAAIQADADFYRVGVDQLPVSAPVKED